MKGIRHWIEIHVKRLDGIHVYDDKRKPGHSVRTLKKISAIASFSRNRRTESTDLSLPLIPTGGEETQNKDGSLIYFAKWNCRPSKIDDDSNSSTSMISGDPPQAEPILLETNLHPKKKKKKNREVDELAPFEAKDFEIFVGMRRQDEFIVFGASILTINAAVDCVNMKLPLYPLGKPKKKGETNSDGNESNSSGSNAVNVEPIHFDDDDGRKFALAIDAHLTVSISVADTATYCLRKMNQVTINSSDSGSSRKVIRSRSSSPRRVQSERPPRNTHPHINLPRSNSMQNMGNRGVQFSGPSMQTDDDGYSFHGSHDVRQTEDDSQAFGMKMTTTFGDGVSRISMPDDLGTFAETKDGGTFDDSQFGGRGFSNNNANYGDARSVTFSVAPDQQNHRRRMSTGQFGGFDAQSVQPSVAVTKGPHAQLFEAIYGNVDDYTIATKDNTLMGQSLAGTNQGKSFDPLRTQTMSFDQGTYGQSTIGENTFGPQGTFDQSTHAPGAFNPGTFHQSVYNLGTFDQSTIAPGTIDQRSYAQGTFDRTIDEQTYDQSSRHTNGDGTQGQPSISKSKSSRRGGSKRSMSRSKSKDDKGESLSDSESESEYSGSSGSDDESSSESDSSSASSTVQPPEQILPAMSMVREDITLDGASYARSVAERRAAGSIIGSVADFENDMNEMFRPDSNRSVVSFSPMQPPSSNRSVVSFRQMPQGSNGSVEGYPQMPPPSSNGSVVSFRQPPPGSNGSVTGYRQMPPPSSNGSVVSFRQPPPGSNGSVAGYRQMPPGSNGSVAGYRQMPPPSSNGSVVSFRQPPPGSNGSVVGYRQMPPPGSNGSVMSYKRIPPQIPNRHHGHMQRQPVPFEARGPQGSYRSGR